jgi:cell shape-determining protein MreD
MRLRNYHPKKLAWPVLGLTFIASWIIQALVGQFACWNISTYLLGFWITYPALNFSFGTGLMMSFIIGLWAEAFTPLPLGTQAIIASLSYIILQLIRQTTRKMGDLPFNASACGVNGLCLLFLSIWLKNSSYPTIDYWQNIGLISVFSTIIILCISPIWILTLNILLKK